MTTLIDIKELSQRLSIAVGTLYNWASKARRGRGPFANQNVFTKIGGSLRFDVEAVENLLSRSIIGERPVRGEGA
jgi:hypothetical protein